MSAQDFVSLAFGTGGLATAGATWRMVRANKRKTLAEAHRAESEGDAAEQSAAAVLTETLLSGAKSVLVMKDGELENLQERLAHAEELIAQQAKRLEECERHGETIDDLRRQVDELHGRLEQAEERAERYLRERNDARDELRQTKAELERVEARLAELEQRVENSGASGGGTTP